MNIGPLAIGGANPCRLVAEISNNHNGSLDRAFRMIDAAKESGCDAVKMQAFTPEELCSLRGDGPAPEPWGSQGWTMEALYRKAQTPLSWFGELAAKCADVGIPWFASVFGAESLAEMEYVGCPAYKIASFERDAGWLYQLVKHTKKPVIVSRPDAPDPRFDLNLFCPPGYPQSNPEYNPAFDGFSYHGTSTEPITAAIAKGASLVEFHFHLHDEPSELEANVSITDRQIREMLVAK